MKDIFLSVIIPAYNESKRITNTLLDIDYYLSKQDYSYEILEKVNMSWMFYINHYFHLVLLQLFELSEF